SVSQDTPAGPQYHRSIASHQFREGSLAMPRFVGRQQIVIAGRSESAHFLIEGQVTQQESDRAAAHVDQATNRVSLGIHPANGVRPKYFAKKSKNRFPSVEMILRPERGKRRSLASSPACCVRRRSSALNTEACCRLTVESTTGEIGCNKN